MFYADRGEHYVLIKLNGSVQFGYNYLTTLQSFDSSL